MKKLIIIPLLFIIFLSSPLNAQLPYIDRSGPSPKLIVDGKPFLMIAGELHNSTSSGIDYMEKSGIWETLRKANLNTVIASASWELIEPEEGRYNFEQVDYIADKAREANLKVVLIWFASWKNIISTYAPGWIKRDQEKYRLVESSDGTTLNILSPVNNPEAMKADAKAFAALMRHIRENGLYSTIIMVQVENEAGIFPEPRDYSPAAEKAWKSDVPADLIAYLTANKGSLYPELQNVWGKNGYRTKGTWEEVFGRSYKPTVNRMDHPYYTEELFMAYHYAKYIGYIAAEGKKELDIPMYCNAWLKSEKCPYPGKFPSGGPLPEVIDIWRAAAPEIDFIAPDIYIDEFDRVLKSFSRSGNPIFIPKCTFDIVKELYAFGEYDALGFGPFGIDIQSNTSSFNLPDSSGIDNLYRGNGILRSMDQLILRTYGSERMQGLFVDESTATDSMVIGDFIISASLLPDNNLPALHSDGKPVRTGAALVIRAGNDEFYIAGRNVMISFELKDPGKGLHAVTESVDEGTFRDGKWVPQRRLNGDEGYIVRINDINLLRIVLFISRYDNRIMY